MGVLIERCLTRQPRPFPAIISAPSVLRSSIRASLFLTYHLRIAAHEALSSLAAMACMTIPPDIANSPYLDVRNLLAFRSTSTLYQRSGIRSRRLGQVALRQRRRRQYPHHRFMDDACVRYTMHLKRSAVKESLDERSSTLEPR